MTERAPFAPVSARTFASMFGISRNTVRAYVRAGVIATLPWGRGWRIPAAEIGRVARDGLPSLDPVVRRRQGRRRASAIPPPDIGDRIRALPYGRKARA